MPLGSLHSGSAIAGEETAHQNRTCRLSPSTGHLPGLVMHMPFGRFSPLESELGNSQSHLFHALCFSAFCLPRPFRGFTALA